MAKRDINWLVENIDSTNIADDLKDSELAEIGASVVRDYDIDLLSRKDWDDKNKKGMDLAMQIQQGRSYAGESVSDVMFPMINTGAIQYAARALPAIAKSDEVIKCKPIGNKNKAEKSARGERVAIHMNYQINEQMSNWKQDMDKLLISHCILGDYFKKIYYDPVKKINKSEPVWPKDLVVNYWAKSLEDADCKTHVIERNHNWYLEMVAGGFFLESENIIRPTEQDDANRLHTFLEQHTYYDIDGDGYKEPYIITVHQETKEVVRIIARYEASDIEINEENEKLVRINPREYFTRYMFLPSFDGSFYGTGLGILLSPINESVNTIINQLLDAGTRATRQSGFIGRGVRLLRGGESGRVRLRAGEWLQLQSMGSDLKSNIVPIPAKEPSNVLFQLLGMMVEISKELSSRSDLLSGNQQQHNVPATTTLALIEQGLKVFAGIYQRVFDGLKKEFKMLYNLNKENLDEAEYLEIVDDDEASAQDYKSEDYDICPASTSATITDTQKYIKAQAVREWYGKGLNDQEIVRYYFDALELPAPQVDAILNVPDKGPPPEMIIEMEKLSLEKAKLNLEIERFSHEMQMDRHKAVKLHAEAIDKIASAESKEAGIQMNEYTAQKDAINERIQVIDDNLERLEKIRKEREETIEKQKQMQAQGGQGGNPNRG